MAGRGRAAAPGRHAADPDPLPPLDGPMPGGGPTSAETTLPLALSWPAPPPRTPRFTPSDPAAPPGAPPGWRRVGRPPGDLATPGHAQARVRAAQTAAVATPAA